MQSDPSTSPRRLVLGIYVALLPPEHRGGAELQADRLARELAARGHSVHVFARRQPGCAREERRDGVRVHRRPVLPVPGLRPLAEIVLGALQARRHRPDVLLCYMTFNSGLIGWVASRLCGAPFVIWQRIEAEGLLRAGRWERRAALFLNRRAAALWVQTASFVESLRRHYAAAGRESEWGRRIAPRVRVVGNGLDLPESRGSEPPPAWRFLFVGRLSPQKDLPTLIAAVRRLPEVELWVAGSGELAESLARLAAGAPVKFLGAQPHARLPELLQACRALVLPSLHEGIPNVVLEALAHGRPVVATRVGAIPELVQDGVNGRLVPPGDPVALAAALLALRDDATWNRLAAAARPSVLQFGWPELVSRVEAELARVAGSRTGPASAAAPDRQREVV